MHHLKLSCTRPAVRARLALRRFACNREGVAAVEFGYLMPVMMLMLIGSLEISRAVSMDRRFGLVTALVADMVAQERTMTAAQLNRIYGIADHLMAPYDTNAGNLRISITPVRAAPANAANVTVYASEVNRPPLRGGYNNKARNAAYAMTPGLLEAGATAIVVESAFTFKPLFAGLVGFVHDGFGEIQWTDKAVLAPRQGNCVQFDDNDGNGTPDCL